MQSKTLFNDNWAFTKQPLGSTLETLLLADPIFKPIDLPHDWLISQTTNLYEDGVGWYRKHFATPTDFQSTDTLLVLFEGIYMDSTIYLNKQMVGEWKNGYATFSVDLTPYLVSGVNELLVRVNYQAPNTRWYSGAGIYRDTWLIVLPQTHITLDGIYVSTAQTDSLWTVTVDTEVVHTAPLTVRHQLFTQDQTHCLATCEGELLPTDTLSVTTQAFTVTDVCVWDIDTPVRYILKTQLILDEVVLDEATTSIGFRTIRFDPQEGFFLNHKPFKINGVCEHHDLGCLGASYNQSAMRRRLNILKTMGVNAIRTAHNMPAPGLLDLADEMGFLIQDESFDTWVLSKTTYDYSRFFKEWFKRDVASWVRRDRNHPSVIMWSIGNEIYDIHVDEAATELTRALMEEVLKHDPRKNAYATMGSNYLPWENAQKSGDVLKLVGYNYGEKYYDAHHEKYPDWVIYGSETGAVVQSRGIYQFPYRQSVLTDVNHHCSSLGNATTSWGAKSTEACILTERDCSFSCGQFIWSGFDYIGEPTPYHTKNAYFGQIDTAGFPKDAYYIYQSAWTDYKKAPMVHLYPYWDFNVGQLVDVRVASNAPRVELKLNGKSIGVCDIDHKHGKELVAHFVVPYEPGTLEALAYDEDGVLIATDTHHSFSEATQISLQADRTTLPCGGRELAFVTIGMLDQDGHPVENANNRIFVDVKGNGHLLGLDNGDSTDYEEYKGTTRRLFNGKLLAVIGGTTEAGIITLEVSSPGLPTQTLHLTTTSTTCEGCSTVEALQTIPIDTYANDYPVRKIELICTDSLKLGPGHTSVQITAALLPSNHTSVDLEWAVVDDAGVTSNIATLEVTDTQCTVTAKGDGIFHVRCMCKNNTPHISVISQLDFEVDGLGKAYLNPYDFIAGALYDYSNGMTTNGNEHGVATARDGVTEVGFSSIDFGKFGSDEIYIPIFALTGDPSDIEVWEGIPHAEGSEKIGHIVYQMPSIWNVYQPITYTLNKRLTGITNISFVTDKKIHIKGFSFTQVNPLDYLFKATLCDRIYGDTYNVLPDYIKDIGNNVTVEFNGIDFKEMVATHITIFGASQLPQNTIHLKTHQNTCTQILEVDTSCGQTSWTFPIEALTGLQDLTFVFLPGSQFDFTGFSFK